MRNWNCGRFALPLGQKTYIMGIVNVTPDSFSGDGKADFTGAVEHALRLVDEGADILDIGGESTRPGAEPVEAAEEMRRVVPLVLELAARVEVPLSVDTTKAVVAREVLAAGASIINDISGGIQDDEMLGTLASAPCGVVLMHRRGTPQTMGWSRNAGGQKAGDRADIISELRAYFTERIAAAQAAGIVRNRICLDAGFGFGKSYAENLEIIRRGAELATLGLPTLSATSRKSTIGKALGNVPIEERVWGTAATVALAIASGCDLVRVHDVRAMRDVVRVSDAVVRSVAEAMPQSDNDRNQAD